MPATPKSAAGLLDISTARHMTSRGELTHMKVNNGRSDEARCSGSPLGDIKSVWKEGAVPFVADLGKCTGRC
jgi:hypothetical protein